MERIKETIVVEGKDDETRLKSLFDVDILRTEGTHLSEDCLLQIQKAAKTSGVIIFTDPDHPGEEIRRRINERVRGCKNAYLTSNSRKGGKVGVEHADEKEIREALKDLLTLESKEETLSREAFRAIGLEGKQNSSVLRRKVEDAFHLGHGSAKTLWKRLNHKGLREKDIREILKNA